jgi:hypothetical protein
VKRVGVHISNYHVWLVVWVGILLTQAACSSYYQLNYDFNRSYENGNLEVAERLIKGQKKAEQSKAKFLYYVNSGMVTSLLGKYEESNEYFEKAYLFGEDYQKNILDIALSNLTNPSVAEYKGEDHEHLMVLYYKALNYLKLGDRQAALVECRRLNLRLASLSDRYQSGFKYKEDAFIQVLMGIIYDADKDYNNAFIAYKNALAVYQNSYSELFGLQAPAQLKQDLMRTAHLMGFYEDLAKYETQFGLKYKNQPSAGGDLVMFWNNGLGPIKSEWSINFATVTNGNGVISFVNEDYGINLPFNYNTEQQQSSGLADLNFVRVSFPKYVERPLGLQSGFLTVNGSAEQYPLQLSEDVNAIAFKLLNQRMIAEFSKALLRFAIKKAAEKSLKSENENLGALLGFVNALTEKADTRNWQTLPHSIYYARVPLKAGDNEVTMTMNSGGSNDDTQQQKFNFIGENGKTVFHTFHSLEAENKL